MGKRLLLALLALTNLWAAFQSPPTALTVLAVTSVILFSSEVIPTIHTALVILTVLAIQIPRDSQQMVFFGFQSSILYFLIGVTGVGSAVARSNLGRWFMQQIQARSTGSRLPLPVWIAASFAPLSLVLPSSVTRNAMLHPLFRDYLDQHGSREEARQIGLTLGVLNPLASSALLTGGLAPMVSSTLLGGFSWGRWFLFMALPYYLMMAFGLGYILWRYRVPPSDPDPTPVRSAQSAPWKKEDFILLVILFLMVGLWMTDSWHRLQTAVPALIGLVLVLLFTPYLTWDELKRSSVMDNFIILGTMLSLIEATRQYGVLDLLTDAVARIWPAGLSTPTTLLLVVATTIVTNLFIPSITVCLTFLIPILTKLASAVSINPVLVGLVVTMTVDCIKFYPTQSTPLLMVYDRQVFTSRDVLQMGLATTLLLLASLFVVILPYWAMLGLRP